VIGARDGLIGNSLIRIQRADSALATRGVKLNFQPKLMLTPTTFVGWGLDAGDVRTTASYVRYLPAGGSSRANTRCHGPLSCGHYSLGADMVSRPSSFRLTWL
jgi:hypothetical protein